MEETKITGHLPNMMMELSHRAEPDGSAEHIVLRLSASPDFKSALPLLNSLTGLPALENALSGNSVFSLWSDMASQWFAPWVGLMSANPFLPVLSQVKKDQP